MSLQSDMKSQEKFRFYARIIRISNVNSDGMKQIQAKRLWVGKFTHTQLSMSPISQRAYQRFKNNKVFKIVRALKVPFSTRSYLSEALKDSKCLSSYLNDFSTFLHEFDQENADIVKKIAFYLKRLPSQIKGIELKMESITIGNTSEKDIDRIGKCLRGFKNLECCSRRFRFHQGYFDELKNEFRLYDKFGKRTKKLKGIKCKVGDDFYLKFLPMLKKKASSRITALKVEPWVKQFCIVRHLAYAEPSGEDIIGSEEEEIELEMIINKTVRPLLEFKFLPNLKVFHLDLKDIEFPIGPFVVEGLSSLRNLEDLRIESWRKPRGCTFLFEGLAKLPLLKQFALDFPTLTPKEWNLMIEFLEAQNLLESLSLKVTAFVWEKIFYLQQNSHLTSCISRLQKMTSLKSLELGCASCSLESLSTGLAHLIQTPIQLQTFMIEASDDIITSETKDRERIKGLNDFLVSQKNSLRNLSLSLPFVWKSTIVNQLAQTISQIKNIQRLHLFLNHCNRHEEEHVCKSIVIHEADKDLVHQFFVKTLHKEVPPKQRKKLEKPNEWSPNLSPVIQNLEKIEELVLKFDLIGSNSDLKWFVEFLKDSTILKKLKKMVIKTGSKTEKILSSKQEQILAPLAILVNLQNIGTLCVNNLQKEDIKEKIEKKKKLFSKK